MDSQQLSSKVAALEAKVATLEDEGKIIKGEVKQVLTEIRTAILVRDNPFEDAGAARAAAPVSAHTADVSRIEIVTPAPAVREPEPETEPERPYEYTRQDPGESREPIMLRPSAAEFEPAPEAPQWSLLTIASLTAWAEEAMQRLGALRFEILLDLCEAAGHVSPEARAALSRVKELDVPTPEKAPSTNDTVVVLRQLDALLNDEDDARGSLRTLHR